MFNNNTSYQEAINAPARRIVGNVIIKGQKLSDDISSIDYVSSISGNTLTIGATNASTVDIKFKKLIEGLEEKELIKVSFSIQTSSGIVERQIGEFFLTEIKLDRNNKTTTLKAMDKMAFLNDKYTSTLIYPTLGRNIVQEIANSCNLRVNNNLNITNLPSFGKKLEKVTYREMLGYLAQTVGAFVIFNNNGELEFRKLNRTQKQISKGSYLLKGLEVDEVEYRINGISISLNNQEKTILAVGSPLGTQVKLTNPLMTQGWLNSIFSEYSRLRFNPFKLNWRGDPFVEVGDWVSIEIANGSYRAFPILELKLSYSGGLKSTIGANVKGTTTSTTEYKGTVERQIEFINARLGASGNYVYADTVEPTNPKEGDTWFKPNGAFTDLYIYENNQWVLKTSTGNIEGLITKITDSSVSTQNLATAIAKIIELDAARITTGSLSFEQLSSNTVSEIRKGMVSETKFNSFVNDSNGLRQEMSSEVERVFESKKSVLKGKDGINSYIHKKYTNNVLEGPMTDNSNSLYIGIYTGDKALAPTNMSEYEWTRIRGYNGVNSYIHRKYSDYSNGANMSDNSNLKYIGIYTGTSSTPPTTASSYLWSKIKGEDGANGVPGARGADGRTPYFHTAYSNSPTGDRDFSMTNSTNKLYIGTYSDFEVADSNDYRRYKWVKIKGEDGNNGRDGVNSYIHRKYSDNANGSPMSDNSNLKYIGIYTGTSATAPTTPTSYTWSKIKGEDGQQGVPGARGSDGRTSYLHTAYSNSATGDRDFSTTNSTNKEYIGTYTDFEINDSNDYRRYKWIKIKGENGRDGNNGRDGRNGDSYTRNYLSGTADEKILTAVNDNFTTQEAFKLVDDKNFRDLGFVVGDKVTFVADYEVLPNGANKKISKLNFEWYDATRYRYWMNQEINPTKGTFTRTITANNDLLDCKRAFLRTDNVNARIKITNARVIKGDTAQPWSIAQEDLQGHTLTANVRFEGTYINNVTKDLRVFLDVYYDGRKVPSGFNAQVKYKGGNRSDWSVFWNANVDNTGRITNIDWGNREQNGEPLDVIVLVTYKDKDAIASARTDNTPNIGELKETIRRYKKFESTLNEFSSEIGYIKETTQVLGDTVPDILKDSRTQTGNDVYFNSNKPLKANTPYTIVADISGLTAKQEAGIYNASGNTKKYILNGTNFWVAQFPSQQDRVNFYPLGTKTTISNVRIYEGDFTESLRSNLYVTHTINPRVNTWLNITLNKSLEGKDLILYFDVDGDVNNKSFWYNNALSNFSGAPDVEFSLKNKDNVVSVSGFRNSAITLIFNYANPTIKNVRVYEVNYAFRKLTKTQTQNIGTVFKQSAEDIIVAWNNYNKYFSFNNETLDILEKDSYQNKYKKISLTSEGLKIYNNNTLIGTIGTFTHLGQSSRQNTFDIVLTKDTKAFGIYSWVDTWAFDTHLTGYMPILEIKIVNGQYKTNINTPTEINDLYANSLKVSETGSTYASGITKTINVGGRNLKFVQGILVSG